MGKKIFALALVIITMFSCMILPASAATTSYGTSTRTITVNTKAAYYYPGSSSITLKQTQGTYAYSKNGSTRIGKAYYWWTVKVAATDGSHSYTKNFKDGSIQLNLKPNKTYKITISLNTYQNTIQEVNFHRKYNNWRWTTQPSWRVSSTWKVSSYW